MDNGMAADLAILAHGTVHRRHLSAFPGGSSSNGIVIANMNASVRALAMEIAGFMAKQIVKALAQAINKSRIF